MAQNRLSEAELRRIIDLHAAFNLPISGPKNMTMATYIKHMSHDKKVLAGKIRFIIPTGIGSAIVTDDVTESVLEPILGAR